MSVQPLTDAVFSRKKFRVLSVHDLPKAVRSDYVVKGLLEPGALSVVYGEPGCGKTFLALYIGFMVSMKWPVFERRVKGTSVLYLGLESPAAFERRIVAAAQKWAPSACFHFITEAVDLFNGLGDTEAVIDAVREFEAGLVIVDTFARAIGAGSENESADMGQMIQQFDVIRRETGAHVLVVHHSGKDSSRGMRGHSSLLAAADTVIEVRREEDDSRLMRVAKSRESADGTEIPFNLEVVQIGIDGDGDPMTTCVVVPVEGDAPSVRKLKRLSPVPKAALDQLRWCICDSGRPPPPSQQVPAGVTSVTLNEWKEQLLKAGILNAEGNPREQFRRIRVTLQNAKIIGVWDEYVWPVT